MFLRSYVWCFEGSAGCSYASDLLVCFYVVECLTSEYLGGLMHVILVFQIAVYELCAGRLAFVLVD